MVFCCCSRRRCCRRWFVDVRFGSFFFRTVGVTSLIYTSVRAVFPLPQYMPCHDNAVVVLACASPSHLVLQLPRRRRAEPMERTKKRLEIPLLAAWNKANEYNRHERAGHGPRWASFRFASLLLLSLTWLLTTTRFRTLPDARERVVCLETRHQPQRSIDLRYFALIYNNTQKSRCDLMPNDMMMFHAVKPHTYIGVQSSLYTLVKRI